MSFTAKIPTHCDTYLLQNWISLLFVLGLLKMGHRVEICAVLLRQVSWTPTAWLLGVEGAGLSDDQDKESLPGDATLHN